MSDDTKDRGLEKGLTSYGDRGFSLFLRKAFIKGAGYTDDALSRPVVGIINTGSAYNPCHGNTQPLIEAIRRGVMLGGGLPIDFPTISIHESFAHPTSMYLRNLMSMDTEEMLRAQPMDAVVMIGGCDKTVPAQLMGAASANIPAIQLVTGSMLTGSHDFVRVGACTDCRRYWGRYRAEEIDSDEIARVNNQLVASVGTCSVMGTASTMALVAEALGMSVPGSASPPAVTADRIRAAERSGATAVHIAKSKLTPDRIMTAKAFENALRVLLAVGGSTNAVIHLTAVAGRLGIPIDLARLDELGRETPVLVDLKPSGQWYMEDLHRAGGLATVLRELKPCCISTASPSPDARWARRSIPSPRSSRTSCARCRTRSSRRAASRCCAETSLPAAASSSSRRRIRSSCGTKAVRSCSRTPRTWQVAWIATTST